MAYHPYSGPLKNPFNTVANDDEEFGDFATATAITTSGSDFSNRIQQPPSVVPVASIVPAIQNGGVFFNPIHDATSDDEFGDFCGPSVQSAAPLKVPFEQQSQTNSVQPPIKCQPNYDIDLETDLETVTHLPWNGMSILETGVQMLQISEEPDLFDSIGPVSTAPIATDALEDVFALDCPIETPVLQPFADVDHVADAFTDDEFGDFAQADVSPTQENMFGSGLPNHEDVPLNAVSTSQEAPIEVKEPPVLLCDPIVSSITIPEARDDALDSGNVDQIFNAFDGATIEQVSICWDNPLPPIDIVDPVVVSVITDEIESTVPAENVFQTAVANDKSESMEHAQPSGSSEDPVESRVYLEKEDDDFEDFADFQGAVQAQTSEENSSENKPFEASVEVEHDDDDDFGDFDDFTAAPPIANDTVPTAEPPFTPEGQIKKMLSSVFPLETNATAESQANQISASPSGALWSYVSQIESTPALSFCWKHSSAQQRFLEALRIDTILQLQNKKPVMDRWTPMSNHQMPTLTPKCENPLERPNITLDLDFFMAAGTQSTTSNSLLDSIERELLASPTVASPQPVPATVRPSLNESELNNFFDHLQLEPGPTAQSQPVVDLLQ